MSKALTSLKEVAKWFDAGVKENNLFLDSWKRARSHAISAGFFFLKAQSVCPHGQWETFIEDHVNQVKRRTVYFYMQLATAALEWARTEQPTLTASKLQEFATKQVMLMSPKPLVALLRDLRELRPFGEYDAVKYAQRKLGNGAQQEFAFETSFTVLDALTHFGDPGFTFVYPAGRDEAEVISEVETKLEAALTRVRQIKQHGKVIET